MTRPPRLMALAILGWLFCFIVLARLGSWTPFALVGVLLVLLAFQSSAVSLAQFRPRGQSLLIGVSAGVLMVLGTHLAYAWLSSLYLGVRSATRELFSLLNVEGFSPPARTALIVVIASCEEVLFRGLLPGLRGAEPRGLRWPLPREVRIVVGWSVTYALTTVPLASPLLVMCAFVCGTIWGTLRVVTGSILVPMLAHVLWDLGVLLVFPLSS